MNEALLIVSLFLLCHDRRFDPRRLKATTEVLVNFECIEVCNFAEQEDVEEQTARIFIVQLMYW